MRWNVAICLSWTLSRNIIDWIERNTDRVQCNECAEKVVILTQGSQKDQHSGEIANDEDRLAPTMSFTLDVNNVMIAATVYPTPILYPFPPPDPPALPCRYCFALLALYKCQHWTVFSDVRMIFDISICGSLLFIQMTQNLRQILFIDCVQELPEDVM